MTRPLLVRDGDEAWLVTLSEVSVIEAAGNYVQLHFGDRRPLLLHALSALERRLDPDHFFRASRSMIVNLDQWNAGNPMASLTLTARGRAVTFSGSPWSSGKSEGWERTGTRWLHREPYLAITARPVRLPV